MASLSNSIRQGRKRMGLSRFELYLRTGIREATIKRLEGLGSASLPKPDAFNRLVHALQIEPSDLIQNAGYHLSLSSLAENTDFSNLCHVRPVMKDPIA
jgi:transcriptional regulator with XRE-family HTH domain